MIITFDFPAVLAEWPLLAKGVAATIGLTAVSGESRTPMPGSPKNRKNSCTMNGVLRISST